MPSKRTTPRACRQCGIEFHPDAGNDARGGAVFCARACYRLWKSPPLEVRFWRSVDKQGPIPVYCPNLGPCWIWVTGLYGPGRYGQFGRRHGQSIGAHRFSWELAFGPIPDNHQVQHVCNEPRCVRPSHLTLGPPKQNSEYMASSGRSAWGIRNGQARLSVPDVRDIRRRAASGESLTEIARLYGVSDVHVGRIVRRECWSRLRD